MGTEDRNGEPKSGEEASQKAGASPEHVLHEPQRYSLLPRSWQRLQAQLENRTDVAPPSSGANITLQDLARETKRRLEAEQESEYIVNDDVKGPDGGISGWIGTPNPQKFGKGTNYLNTEDLREEVNAGNVTVVDDLQSAVQSLKPWEQELLLRETIAEIAKKRLMVPIDPEDNGGEPGVVSLHDLYRYVHHNPELEALVKSNRDIVEAGGEGLQGSARDAMKPFQPSPDNPYLMNLSHEDARKLEWVRVASGNIWKRRPTRWLRGIDGVQDYNYGVFIHEELTQQALGAKYEGLNPRRVAKSDDYWKDVLDHGPELGMTYMLAAARDVPIRDTGRFWIENFCNRLLRRGHPVDCWGARALAAAVDPLELAANTKLLTSTGTHLRQGSVLYFATTPGNRVFVQAMTPDTVDKREYYSLGSFQDDGAVTGALSSLFLGGHPGRLEQEPPLDEEALCEAPFKVLLISQGVTPDSTMEFSGIRPAPRTLTSAAFKLPPLGASSGTTPALVSDVGKAVMHVHLQSVFLRAAHAGFEAAPPDTDIPAPYAIALRQRAAQKELELGLPKLGINIQGLGLISKPLGPDRLQPENVFDLAEPLPQAVNANP